MVATLLSPSQGPPGESGMARMLIRGQCPNCGGAISDERLASSLPCEACLPEVPAKLLEKRAQRLEFLREVCRLLSESERCGGYQRLLREEEELHEFESFFERAVGSKPWSAQRMWARRVLKGYSFTILAPTGVGKSVFGMVMALFLAARGRRSYIVLPTSVLVRQVNARLQEFLSRLGIDVRVLAYVAPSNKAREELLRRLEQGDYDILVTTSQFLARNFEQLRGRTFDFVFVDDVDAVIKSSRNIDKLLALLGFSEELVNEALRLLKLIASGKAGEDPEGVRRARESLRSKLAEVRHGVLVVSTATGRPRGLRVRLFRELLNFEIGSRAELLRNVVDSYLLVDSDDLEAVAADVAARLGRGGLLFVQPGTPEDRVERLLQLLEERGVRAELITSRNKRVLEAFERGELDVLVGYATYYGLLVRGLDLPHVIRYAVFVNVPHFRLSADVDEASPLRLLQLAQIVRSVTTGPEASSLDRVTATLRRYLAKLDQSAYRALADALSEGKRPEGFLGFLYDRLSELRGLLKELLSRRELLERMQALSLVSIRAVDGRLYVVLPDAPTYLQASGRTSRLYAGGISKGLSVVVTNDRALLEALMKQVKWYVEDARWAVFTQLDLKALTEEIDRDRRLIEELRSGRAQRQVAELVKTALVIVESPTKARTIASFFGRPSRRLVLGMPVYEASVGGLQLLVTASKGHVLDLVTDEGFYGVLLDGGFTPVYATIKRCRDCGEQFTEAKDGACPRCGSRNIVDQAEVVRALQEVSGEVDLVLLATDPDTEGEKIAWDLYSLLAPYARAIKRVEFHEITKRAFEDSLRSPRDVDARRVEAQIIRRVEDRWLGFALSRKLWEQFGMHWLSAGRVQTPVLGWVIEQYLRAESSLKTVFRVTLENGATFTLESDAAGAEARKLAKELRGALARVEEVGVEDQRLAPPPPYSTDTMLKDAVLALGASADEVMRLAQDLFELGLITYHRTDSTHVSALGVSIARTYITERFGEGAFVGRTWGQPGAHECIRPTKPYDVDTLRALVNQGVLQLARPLTSRHYRLYDLIFRRFIASQMPEAVVRVQRVRVTVGPLGRELTAYVGVVSPGFTAVYQPFTLSRVEGGVYKVVEVRHRRRPTVRLYTQADLVARMKEEGIGRPSTYARIISTLLERKYVIETKRHRLVPTELGVKVFNYLKENYGDMVSVERTRRVESLMDSVERGEADYLSVLRMLYEEVGKIG